MTETQNSGSSEAPPELVDLRAHLNRVDEEILRLLAQRARLSLEAILERSKKGMA